MLKLFLKTNIKTYFLFAIFAILLLAPFLLDSNTIRQNDLNGNITPLLNFKKSLIEDKKFLQWNSYINQGIPQTADPLYGIYNPVITIPVILFSPNIAIKFIYVISAFIACVSMFQLLKLWKTPYIFSTLIALTYSSSSYLAARIDAGHLEKVVSFGFLPLFLLTIVQTIRNTNLKWAGITGIILSLILFTGDIYNALFGLYSITLISLYYFLKDRKVSLYLFIAILFFLCFSAIKIIPFIELQAYISKIKEPFAGSHNLISIFYYLFFPFNLLNKIIPTQFFLSNAFGWWENFSFIGPFSIIGILFITKVSSRKNETAIIPLLFVLFILISMPNFNLNPMHFLISNFSIFQFFHVPGRIFAFQSVVILLSFGLVLNNYFKKRILIALLILGINLLLTIKVFEATLVTQKFPTISESDIKAVKYIAKHNPNNYYSLHLLSQGDIPQDLAFKDKTLFLQSNYGLFIKNSPADKYTFGKPPYKSIVPGFIVTNQDTKPNTEYKKINDFENKNITIYTTNKANPFASIDNKPLKSTISTNKVTIYTVSKKDQLLTIIQNNYPGWNIYIDGKKAELTKGGLLSVKTLNGNHKYEFVFFSYSFILGLLISLFSILSFGYYIKVKKATKN